MSIFKYILAVWVSVAVYVLSSLALGPGGFRAYEQLLKEKERFTANLEELKTINKRLEGGMNALRYDADTIMVHARGLGYGEEDERFIRIVGLPGVTKRRMAAGQLMVSARPPALSDKTLRCISIASGFFILLTQILRDLLKKRTLKKAKTG